jgi:RNA polymerase sigma factor (sigma-70 family)
MIPTHSDLFGRRLEGLWTSGTFTGLSDAQLLDRFVRGGDAGAEAAFRELVNRHGPMVLGVCRQILRRHHDTDDAFQATFLVLVRKARSIRVGDSLAPWLYGVAYRTALRARAIASRHRTAGPEEIEESAANSPGASFELDARPLLHEELARLPGKYRDPIVLCHLEGKSHEEAARLLSWPVGTVSGRLSRGRRMLRARLERRGVSVPSAVLAERWVTGSQAALMSSLIESTSQAATRLAHAATTSSSVLSLARGVLYTMMLDKLKTVALALVVVGAASGGVATWAVLAPTASQTSGPGLHAVGQVSRLPDGPISEIRFEGETIIPSENVKARLESKVGQPLDHRKIEADIKSLMRTNWFSQVDAYFDESPPRTGKYALIYTVRERSQPTEGIPRPGQPKARPESEMTKTATAPGRTEPANLILPGRTEYDPNTVATVRVPFDCRVDKVLVDLGARVRRGDPILELFSADLAAAKGDYELALSQYLPAKKVYDYKKPLAENNTLPRKELIEIESDMAQIQLRMKLAKDRLLVFGLTEQEIEAAKKEDGVQKARMTLRARADGIVVKRDVVQGNYYDSKDTLLTIVPMDHLWVRTRVPENDAAKVQLGQAVTTTFPLTDPLWRIRSKIEYIDPSVDPDDRSVEFRTSIPNPGGRFKAGASVRVQVLITPQPGPDVMERPGMPSGRSLNRTR